MTRHAQSRRRWFQFRLRTLLIVVLVLSLPLSWFALKTYRVRRQREAAEAIRELGGEVSYDWEILYAHQRNRMGLHESMTPMWIRAILGKEYSDVVAVTLGENVRDSDLSSLDAFPNLRSLELVGTPVTHAAVNRIASLTTLRNLDLDTTGIAPNELEILATALPACSITTLRPVNAPTSDIP